MKIPARRLRAFSRDVFRACGVSSADAELCADVLIAADLRGIDTHGISRLKYYADRLASGITKPGSQCTIVRKTATTAVLDAKLGIGMAVAVRAMKRAISMAKRHGFGGVAVRGATHFGIAGYYSLLAAQRGLIGVTTTNARPAVAPTFSVKPVFGTNPLAFAAPSDEPFPFCFDAALSTIQRGNVEVAARTGEALPAGIAVDRKGKPVTNPRILLDRMSDLSAALLPLGGAGEEFGGHKGYGLAMVVEILSAALQGGDFLSALAGGVEKGKARPYRLGHFFLAIDPAFFTGTRSFRATVGSMMRELRRARKAPGQRRVWVPGEKEWESQKRRERAGIPVSRELISELDELARHLRIKSPVA